MCPGRPLTDRSGRSLRGIVPVRAAADRRCWSLLCGRLSARATTHQKRPVEAAGAMDAKNAPTAPWKTGRPVFHSYHRLSLLSLVTGKVSPMFPVNFVSYVPGCTHRLEKASLQSIFTVTVMHTGIGFAFTISSSNSPLLNRIDYRKVERGKWRC